LLKDLPDENSEAAVNDSGYNAAHMAAATDLDHVTWTTAF